MTKAMVFVRAQINRVLLVIVVPLAFSHLIIAERLKLGDRRRAVLRWLQVGAFLTGLQFESRGSEQLRGDRLQLLLANHSSPLDIAALLFVHPQSRFVAGADLFRIPLLAGAMRAVGTVPVDRRSEQGTHLELPATMDPSDATAVVVFPEGGIAPRGRRLPFHRGAFALAIDKKADVVPVAIHYSSSRLPPKAMLAVRPGRVFVEFLPSISTEAMTHADRHELCQRTEQAILEALGPEDGGRRGSSGTAPVGSRPV